jgi:flavin-dependent dehydrogenase
MNQEYDVIIIGGGPSGSTTGTFLAREGMNVLILEKEVFPREHVGESLLPFSYTLFEEMGLLEYMKENYTRKPGVTFSNADGSKDSHWCFDKVLEGPSSLSFHVRRSLFDDFLLKNSRKEGVVAIEGVMVTDVEYNPHGLGVKVMAHHKMEGAITYTGKFLIDASGQDSFLAKKLKNQKPFERLNVRLAISSHWENVQLNESLSNGNITIIHFGGEKLGWIWLIPLAEGRLSIGLAINMDYANRRRKELIVEFGPRKWHEALYLQELSESPLVMRIIENANMCWDVVTNGDFSYYAEEKYGPSFAMIGDSGAFLDPIFSSGIYLGMTAAKLVAPNIAKYIKTGDFTGIQSAYKTIEDGYVVVEDLILAFYEPTAIAFPELAGSAGVSHEQFESIYSVYHMLLAGDFFNQSERYRAAIAALRNPEMIEKYRNLKKHSKQEDLSSICTPKLEEVMSDTL